jgi:hypothetical protein
MDDSKAVPMTDENMWDHEAIHLWFGLTYANYLVMPRSILQSMPDEWQKKFVLLLNEARETFPDLDWPSYRCMAVDESTGRFIKDPIPHYNRGRTRLESKASDGG